MLKFFKTWTLLSPMLATGAIGCFVFANVITFHGAYKSRSCMYFNSVSDALFDFATLL